MKTITKGKNMNNYKKIGLTALAGSLAAISANAAEMTVSGATALTYTSDHGQVTGNPLGMKTNLGFTASGEVNGYTVSYMQTSKDQFAGMSSARLSVDMGDMGLIALDQGSGSGLSTIDDKTPTAAEEIWDGLDVTTSGRVGAVGSSGVVNYVNSFAGVNLNAAFRKGAAGSNADGASSGEGKENTGWDFALTTSETGVEGLTVGAGYGKVNVGQKLTVTGVASGDKQDATAFATYNIGMVSLGYQMSVEDNNVSAKGKATGDQEADRWGVAFNINENMSVSYGEAETTFLHPSAAKVTEDVEGIAVSYTMGAVKIAGNRNEGSNMGGVAGDNDKMTEVAVSFAF